MADDYKFQLSISVPHSGSDYSKADMVNIRANDANEFASHLQAFQDANFSTLVAEAAANIRAAYLVARDLGGSVVQHETPQNAPQTAQQPPQGYDPGNGSYAPQSGSQGYYGNNQQGYPQQPQQPQNNGGVPTTPPPHVGPAPECSHGVKRFIAKPNRNGKGGYWMAWACPAQRNDPTQHELQFIPNR